jgi:hypothetical protein
MYNGRAGLGIAPLVSGAVLYAAPRVINWLTGHSTIYSAMQAAIPELQQLALAGDVPAYIVLRAWYEEGEWCPLAERVARPYLINMPATSAGPCGAPPWLKSLVLQAVVRVTGNRPDVAAVASQALTAGPAVSLQALIDALPAGAVTSPASDRGAVNAGPSTATTVLPASLAGIPPVVFVLAAVGVGVWLLVPSSSRGAH